MLAKQAIRLPLKVVEILQRLSEEKPVEMSGHVIVLINRWESFPPILQH